MSYRKTQLFTVYCIFHPLNKRYTFVAWTSRVFKFVAVGLVVCLFVCVCVFITMGIAVTRK